MAFTLTQLQALEAAIGSGTLEVEYDGKRVKYHSMGDLVKAYNLVKSQLEGSGALVVAPGTNRGPSSLAVFSRD